MPENGNDRLVGTPTESQPAPQTRQWSPLSIGAVALSAVITMAALAGVIVHLADPNLKVDSIVVALLVIAIIPWLGLIFKSVEIPGLFKGEFQELREKVKRVEEVGRENSAQITKVEDSVDNEVEDQGGALQTAASKGASVRPAVPVMPSQHPQRQLDALIQEYDHIRATQSAGSVRTLAMTRVIEQMIELAPQLQDFDWTAGLNSSDRGVRLAAYAFLYACPKRDAVSPLVSTAVYAEDKPFGQYWALLALEKAMDQLDCDSTRKIQPILEQFQNSLRSGTDRYVVIDRLLAKVRELCGER